MRSFASGFTDVHAFTRLPGSPGDYGLGFPEPRLGSPSSWRARLKRVRSASFTYFEALFPLQDRSCNSGLPLGCRSFLSWVFAPSKP